MDKKSKIKVSSTFLPLRGFNASLLATVVLKTRSLKIPCSLLRLGFLLAVPNLEKDYLESSNSLRSSSVLSASIFFFKSFDIDNIIFGTELEERDYIAVPKDYSISFVMVDKSFEDYCAPFNLESEDKTSNMNSFVIAQAMPKILEMLNRRFITRYNLLDFFVDCDSKGIIFPSNIQEDLLQAGRNNKFKSHFKPSNLCNSFKVIGFPTGSFLAFFNSSINSFFIGNSSTGCQSILSQNSWSSGDNLRDFIYSSNISFLRDSSLLISDQLTQGNDIILALNSSDTDKVIDAIKNHLVDFCGSKNRRFFRTIYISPLLTSSWNLSNCFNLTANRSFKYSAQFMSGCLSNFIFNLSGIDTVKVVILVPPQYFVNTLEFVDIFKTFGSDIFFDRIASIKQHSPQHVYDLMIENTHNFIANDIIAHNTYINNTLNVINGGVGIGTTSPTHELNVVGDMNVTGTSYVGDDKKIYFGVDSDANIMFILKKIENFLLIFNFFGILEINLKILHWLISNNSTGGYGELG